MAPGPINYASAHENRLEDKALRELRLEGSVVLKIVKHCQESQPFLVTGQLLGLDIGSSLEVTDCFPFPVCLRPSNGSFISIYDPIKSTLQGPSLMYLHIRVNVTV